MAPICELRFPAFILASIRSKDRVNQCKSVAELIVRAGCIRGNPKQIISEQSTGCNHRLGYSRHKRI